MISTAFGRNIANWIRQLAITTLQYATLTHFLDRKRAK